MSITCSDLKNHLDEYLVSAEKEPVIVEEAGNKKSVLMSYAFYKRLMALTDLYWAERAKQAEAEGYLGTEASLTLLNRY